ncbi:MAG: hypothetical protein M3450_11855 [Actinomycetota bacterium]|nr:hypothetical protein [Actinomycetota bacterium]
MLKLRTTRSFYGNALAVLAFVPLLVAIAIQTAGGDGGGAPLDTSEGLRNVLSAAASGTAMVNIIGIMIMAGEFRHNTRDLSLSGHPEPHPGGGAKLIAVTLVGIVLGVVASILALVIAVPWPGRPAATGNEGLPSVTSP